VKQKKKVQVLMTSMASGDSKDQSLGTFAKASRPDESLRIFL
jgi:hypothetical protein